jgi:hypothetical protein
MDMAVNYQDIVAKLQRAGRLRDTEVSRQPTDTETMSAQEVQKVVGANQQAAQMGTEGLFTGGLGQTGRGAWYSMLGPGNAVTDYGALAQAAPGPYVNTYRDAINRTMNGLLNAQPFRYDVNADGLYQQIKDNYLKAARQGMMDTQAQSAALTGGYGNSYGAQAGQQAYQESLGNLTAMVPELYQLAYQRYLQGQDDQRNNLEAMYKLEGQDYSRWLEEAQNYQQLMASLPAAVRSGGMVAGGGGYMGPSVIYPTGSGAQTGGTSINLDNVIALQKQYATGALNPYQMMTQVGMGYTFPGVSSDDIRYAAMTYLGYSPDTDVMAVPTSLEYQKATPIGSRLYTGGTRTGTGTQTGAGTQTGTGSVIDRNREYVRTLTSGT